MVILVNLAQLPQNLQNNQLSALALFRINTTHWADVLPIRRLRRGVAFYADDAPLLLN